MVWFVQLLLEHSSLFCKYMNISTCFIQFFRSYLWSNFLHGYRLSWFSCGCWNNLPSSVSMEGKTGSFYKRTSLWFWGSSLVLALCRCGMVIFICSHIHLGKLKSFEKQVIVFIICIFFYFSFFSPRYLANYKVKLETWINKLNRTIFKKWTNRV